MPNGNLTYKRGEICWVNLDPTVGAETKKTRTCLIIQNDIMNQYGPLTIIMPFLPGAKNAPYVVNIKATATNGLNKDRYIDIGNIRAVDNTRILGMVGVLETEYWESIRTALDIVLGFNI